MATKLSADVDKLAEEILALMARDPGAEQDEDFGRRLQEDAQLFSAVIQPLPLAEKRRVLNFRHTQLLVVLKRCERQRAREASELAEVEQECERARTEQQAVKTATVRLQALCDQLRHQNQQILDETRRSAEQDEKQREALSQQYKTHIDEMAARVAEDAQKSMKSLETIEELQAKYNSFMEQFRLREQHIAKVIQTKDLETQLAMARLAQSSQLTQQTQQSTTAFRQKCTSLAESERELRSQLASYAEKFAQFQDTLSKSNEFFTTFRKERDLMAERIAKLTAENAGLKSKWEAMSARLAHLVQQRAEQLKVVQSVRTKSAMLEQLCNALRTQRNELRLRVANLDENCPILARTLPKDDPLIPA